MVATIVTSSSSYPAAVFLPPTPGASANSDAAQKLIQNGCSFTDNRALLVFWLNHVDVMAGTATANLSMCMGNNVESQLRHQEAGASHVNPTLTINAGTESFSTQLVPIAREQSKSNNFGTLDPIGAITIPIAGYPRMYPADRYLGPIDFTLSTNNGEVGLARHLWPIIMFPEWYVEPAAANLSWGIGRVRGVSASPDVHMNSEELVAQRPIGVELFVWVIVAIPLLLIILLGLVLWHLRSGSVEGLVGVGAVMLAILPIRAVLIPGEITSLTIVDFPLASEMALLAAVTPRVVRATSKDGDDRPVVALPERGRLSRMTEHSAIRRRRCAKRS